MLINGIGAHVDMWQPLAQRLHDVRLIAFDAPGTGALQTPVIRLTLGQLARLGPYPAVPEDVMAYLQPLLEGDPIGIAPAAYPQAVRELKSAGVAGGAVYDGLIGLAAR